MLDVKRLRVLQEVAACGSFSAAAESLSYTQSAVSQQIAALERETGTRLVERGARGVVLTDAGRSLVIHADAVICRLADAEAELEAIAGLRGGRLRLVSIHTAGATILPPAIARFRERHPEVELILQPAELDDGLALLRAGEADIAVRAEADFLSDPEDGIVRAPLLDDPMSLILAACHPLAKRRRIRLEELADEAWILGSTSTCPDTSLLLRACQSAGFEPRIAFHSDDYLSTQGFVAAGVGVAFIPNLALIAVRDDVVVHSLGSKPPMRRIVAATLDGSYESPAKVAMLAILAEVGREFEGRSGRLTLVS